MPELPEVEVVCRGLLPHLKGRTIKKIKLSSQKLRLPLPRKLLQRWVVEAVVVAVRRRAKFCVIELDNGARLVFHLGMTGRLGLFQAASALIKHDHCSCAMDNGMALRFNDVRRFGSVQVVSPDAEEEDLFAGLGPEPFAREFAADYAMKRAAGRQQPVKNFLMDNRVVVGIGNIYASEILFEAGISPVRPAREVSMGEWEQVVRQARAVLKRAIQAGGSTISDFVNSSGQPGYFQLQLKVYGRAGQPCMICGGAITKEVLAGRATFFCEHCQQ